MAIERFQSLKGLILTDEKEKKTAELNEFQSLKGLILTRYCSPHSIALIGISIPQRSYSNLELERIRAQNPGFQSLKGLILTRDWRFTR